MTYDPLREANPVPFEDSMPSDAWNASVLLDVIDERHALMDVKELAKAPEPDTRNNWTAALVAAAAVIVVVVGTLMFVNMGDGDTPPADQPAPAPSTTVADAADAAPPTTAVAAAEEPAQTSAADPAELTASEREFVEGFFDAYNDGRYEDVLSFMAPNIRVEDGLIWNGARDRFEESLVWREAMNERWILDSCVKYTAFVCQIQLDSDAYSFAYGPNPTSVRIAVADGVITELIFIEDGALVVATLGPFYEWVGERYPDAIIAGGGDPGQPVSTPESTALWVQYLAEYKAEMGFTD